MSSSTSMKLYLARNVVVVVNVRQSLLCWFLVGFKCSALFLAKRFSNYRWFSSVSVRVLDAIQVHKTLGK